MGFTTGLLGGITLASSVVYFSLAMHTQNRNFQRLLLRQQAQVLSDIIEPQPPIISSPVREEHISLVETAKDRWNGELVSLVRRLQTTDWAVVREDWEKKAMSLFDNLRKQ